jgi:predicted amidohydrolase
MTIQPYRAVAIQSNCWSAATKEDVRRNIKRKLELIDYACDSNRPCKLIVFPEFFLQGSRVGAKRRTLAETLAIALTLPGEESEQFAQKAKEYKTFIVGCAIEVDPKYPAVYFNTAFIINPQGEIALKYRKVFTFTLELTASPHDLLGQYEEDPFPVLDSEIGKIGCLIAYDAIFPETARALALKGAEIIARPTSWVGYGGRPSSTAKWWRITNEIRALENSCYIVGTNKGDILNSFAPEQSMVGNSMIVDYTGQIISQIEGKGENICGATIDLEALRHYRRQVGLSPLTEIRTEMIKPLYERTIYPAATYLERIPQKDTDLHETARKNLERLQKEGLIE